MKTEGMMVRIIGIGVIILIFIALVVLGIYAAPSSAQTQIGDETTALPRTITVVGEGSVRVEPDVAEATIGVRISRPTVEEATHEAETTMDAILATLQEQGIAEEDIQTSGFNVFVEQPFQQQGQPDQMTTYWVSNNVQVTIHNLEQVGPVLDAALKAGANNIFGVNFSLDDAKLWESEARQHAMADAQIKAQELAELASVELGQVISVSEVTGDPHTFQGATLPIAEGVGGQGDVGSISPGDLEVRSQLEVVYVLN